MWRTVRTVLCGGAALVLAAAGAPAVAAPAQASPKPPRLVWTDCPPNPLPDPTDPNLRCTTLRVPLDHRRPSGRTIEIAVSKLSTAKPGLRRGVLVHNGGGPGVPSLHLPALYAAAYPQEVLDRYDLVSFDPRGVGRSTPVTCGRTPAEVPNEEFMPFPAPDGSITANVAFARELARDCIEHSGDLLPYITTANTARDLDLVRAALGEQRLSYLAGSYGSYLGAVYATLYPRRTDRIVLDANVDPTGSVWPKAKALWDPGTELRFPDFAEWAVERNADLGLGATPAQVRQNFLDLAARLDRTPATHPDAGRVNGNLFRAIFRLYAYHTLYFPQIASWWRWLERGGELPVWGTIPVTDGIPQDNDVAALLAVTCSDSRWPSDTGYYQRKVAAHRAAYPLMAGMGANLWPCAFWPEPVEPPVRITDRGPANILLVQTLRDPATPYSGALAMRGALGQRAQLVTVDSGNHGAYDPFTPSCATRETHRFLATGARPARGLSCRPDPAPEAAAKSAAPAGRLTAPLLSGPLLAPRSPARG
ncbi:alpha/beta hydrolase [Kitasatospora sp. NPDC054939]